MKPNGLGVALTWAVAVVIMGVGATIATDPPYAAWKPLVGATLVFAGGLLAVRIVYVWRKGNGYE